MPDSDVKIRITTEDKTQQGTKQATEGFKDLKGTIGDVTKELTGFSLSQLSVAGAVGMVATQVNAAITSYMSYADSMDKLSMVMGTSVEETSRLVQVADDFRVEQSSVEAAMRMAVQNGFTPTIDSIAQLADKYNSISDPVQRAAAMQEVFGRAWKDMVPLLEQGGDAIRAAAADMDAGMIVTQKQAEEAKAAAKAIDDWNDSWTSFKNTLASGALPAITETIGLMQRQNSIVEDAGAGWLRYIPIVGGLTTVISTVTAMFDKGTDAADQNSAAMGRKADSDRYAAQAAAYLAEQEAKASEQTQTSAQIGGYARDQFVNLAEQYDSAASASEKLATSLNKTNSELSTIVSGGFGKESKNFAKSFDDLSTKGAELKEKLDFLTKRQPWKKDDIEKTTEALKENGTALDELKAKHNEAMRTMAFNMIQQRAASDGLTKNEVSNLTAIAKQWGLYDEQTAAIINSINANMDKLDSGNADGLISDIETIMALPDTKEITVETKVKGAGEIGLGDIGAAGIGTMGTQIGGVSKSGQAAMKQLSNSVRQTNAEFAKTDGIQTMDAALAGGTETVGGFSDAMLALQKNIATSLAVWKEFMANVGEANGAVITIHVNVETSYGSGSGVGQGNEDTCFVYDTPINIPGGTKPIGEVRAGDILLTKTVAGPVEESPVLFTRSAVRNDVVKVELLDGRTYICSPNHEWKIKPGVWVWAEFLKPGDGLYTIDDEPASVLRVSKHPGSYEVFDIRVSHPEHTIMVNGVVVHNTYKATGGPVFGGNAILVGENGPEIFQPTQDGTILSNGQSKLSGMGGITINGPITVVANDPSQFMAALGQAAQRASQSGAGYAGAR